jgi:hypothetical protein
MSTDRDHRPVPRKRYSNDENILLARQAIALIRWRWFPDFDLLDRPDEQGHIPQLLFGLYLAAKQNKKIGKREACELMGVDVATTGPRYIAALETDDLISIDNYPDIDKRKDFLTPTLRLIRIVEKELLRLGRNLTEMADILSGVHQASMFDPAEASRLPSGGPSPDNLLPVDWPPDTVGTPFKSALKR